VRAIHRPTRPGPATITVEAGYATLEFRRFLRHSPSEIWEALTKPELIRQWFLTEVRAQERVGGKIDLETGPDRVHATGRIRAWDPPRLYEYEWNTSDKNHPFPGERSVIRWELTPRGEGTLLVLTHRDLTTRTARVFGHGIPAFLDRLEALLDGRPLGDREPRFGTLRGSVLKARGPDKGGQPSE